MLETHYGETWIVTGGGFPLRLENSGLGILGNRYGLSTKRVCAVIFHSVFLKVLSPRFDGSPNRKADRRFGNVTAGDDDPQKKIRKSGSATNLKSQKTRKKGNTEDCPKKKPKAGRSG